MTGMFRMKSAGKVSFYELMSIEDPPAGPVLRLRHLDAQLDTRDAQTNVFPVIGNGARQECDS